MEQTEPKVAILPSHIKLGASPGLIGLDRLIWPLGQPDGIQGKHLRDLTRNDHVIVFPRNTLHVRPGFGTRANVSVMVMEPSVIHGHHMKMLRWSHRRFFRVLTCNEALIASISNGVFFPHGSTWVPEWRDLDVTKTKMVSLIASAKRSQEGHQLRHEIADWAQVQNLNVDVMGGGYNPFDVKSDGLASYRFSIVIENVRERNYFTEKLIDAVLCDTVPIYWGCPNISDFMETKGMILCETADDLRRAVKNVSIEDYAARISALNLVKGRADHWGGYMARAARAVVASV